MQNLMNHFAKEVGYSECKSQFHIVHEIPVIIADCRMHQTMYDA